MCLAVLAWRAHPRYRLIVAANRDEYHARPTTPLAAWGDPPIVLRCGVGRPEDMAPTSEAVEIDGVSWFPQQLTAGYRFTTTGLGTRVEVTVPAAYAPETGPLVDLSPVIAASMPSVTRKAVPAS